MIMRNEPPTSEEDWMESGTEGKSSTKCRQFKPLNGYHRHTFGDARSA